MGKFFRPEQATIGGRCLNNAARQRKSRPPLAPRKARSAVVGRVITSSPRRRRKEGRGAKEREAAGTKPAADVVEASPGELPSDIHGEGLHGGLDESAPSFHAFQSGAKVGGRGTRRVQRTNDGLKSTLSSSHSTDGDGDDRLPPRRRPRPRALKPKSSLRPSRKRSGFIQTRRRVYPPRTNGTIELSSSASPSSTPRHKGVTMIISDDSTGKGADGGCGSKGVRPSREISAPHSTHSCLTQFQSPLYRCAICAATYFTKRDFNRHAAKYHSPGGRAFREAVLTPAGSRFRRRIGGTKDGEERTPKRSQLGKRYFRESNPDAAKQKSKMAVWKGEIPAAKKRKKEKGGEDSSQIEKVLATGQWFDYVHVQKLTFFVNGQDILTDLLRNFKNHVTLHPPTSPLRKLDTAVQTLASANAETHAAEAGEGWISSDASKKTSSTPSSVSASSSSSNWQCGYCVGHSRFFESSSQRRSHLFTHHLKEIFGAERSPALQSSKPIEGRKPSEPTESGVVQRRIHISTDGSDENNPSYNHSLDTNSPTIVAPDLHTASNDFLSTSALVASKNATPLGQYRPLREMSFASTHPSSSSGVSSGGDAGMLVQDRGSSSSGSDQNKSEHSELQRTYLIQHNTTPPYFVKTALEDANALEELWTDYPPLYFAASFGRGQDEEEE